MNVYRILRGRPEQPIRDRFHHLAALAVIWLFFACSVACKPGSAKAPTAEYIAGLTINTVALGVRVADEHCAMKARQMFKEGDRDGAIDLASKCAGHYDAARNALMAAAYAVDAWADAAQRGKAVCALNEATTSLSHIVEALKKSGIYTPPREVVMALAAVAVLAEMVEAKSCPLPSPAASGGGQ